MLIAITAFTDYDSNPHHLSVFPQEPKSLIKRSLELWMVKLLNVLRYVRWNIKSEGGRLGLRFAVVRALAFHQFNVAEVGIVVGSRLCNDFFLRLLRFSSLHNKTNNFKFQFNFS